MCWKYCLSHSEEGRCMGMSRILKFEHVVFCFIDDGLEVIKAEGISCYYQYFSKMLSLWITNNKFKFCVVALVEEIKFDTCLCPTFNMKTELIGMFCNVREIDELTYYNYCGVFPSWWSWYWNFCIGINWSYREISFGYLRCHKNVFYELF